MSRKSDTTNVVGAGATGGALGTVIATIANGMDASVYKSALIISAPLITVGISGVWLFLKTVFIDSYVNKKADEIMQKALTDARANEDRVLNNPNSSPVHKRQVRKIIEDLEKLILKRIAERTEITLTD
jgi:hypothetical protein